MFSRKNAAVELQRKNHLSIELAEVDSAAGPEEDMIEAILVLTKHIASSSTRGTVVQVSEYPASIGSGGVQPEVVVGDPTWVTGHKLGNVVNGWPFGAMDVDQGGEYTDEGFQDLVDIPSVFWTSALMQHLHDLFMFPVGAQRRVGNIHIEAG